jgi:hypothetical protein
MVIHHPTDHRLLQAFPTMPATVIAERVGWTRGKTVFAERVRELRPGYLPPDRGQEPAVEVGHCLRVELLLRHRGAVQRHVVVDSRRAKITPE